MSKWPLWEEQQVYGTDERTPFISRCHQVLPKVIWSFQVYLGIINLTLIQPNVQVVMLTGEIMITTMRVTGFSLKESSHGGADRDQLLPNHLFWRLNSRLENYNPARPWTVPEPRHRCSPPWRTCSTSHNAARVAPHHSQSVSFVENTPNPNSSLTRRVNVNIVTPGCVMMPSILHPRGLTPQRPTSPPLYTPPYHPDPSPSPSIARTNTPSCQMASPVPDEITSGEAMNVNTWLQNP